MQIKNNKINNGWKNDGFDNYNDNDFEYDLKYLNRMRHLHNLDISLDNLRVENVYEQIPYGNCKMIIDVYVGDVYGYKLQGIEKLRKVEYTFFIDENSTWLDLWRLVDRVVLKDSLDFQILDGFDFTPTPRSKNFKGIITPRLLSTNYTP